MIITNVDLLRLLFNAGIQAYKMQIIKGNKGFTLIEVMITILIMVIGLSAMTIMQIQAMKGNQSAFSRSSANTIALTLVEELKRLSFDDTNLIAGGNLDAGKAVGLANPTPALADHLYVPANFPALTNTFQVNGNNIVGSTGTEFQIFWNVQKPVINFGGKSYIPICNLRLFMYWNTPMGRNSLIITTIKYNNTEV